MVIDYYKVSKFWFVYFLIRVGYLLFAVLIYSKLTILGDTPGYLSAGINFSPVVFYSSTSLMICIGGLVGAFLGGMNVISNLPFMLFSFYIIRWTVETLQLRRYISDGVLLLLLSLPNFCIWTSVCSKEVAGLAFSAILGVLIINFLKGDYIIRKRDWLGVYLCLLFKPQYFPFIFQGLFYLYLTGKYLKSPFARLAGGVVMLLCNILFIYLIRDIVNEYAGLMYNHFNTDTAQSTRNNLFLKDNDFFRYAPWGMFIAFFGPTFGEMTEKVTYFLSGMESLVILFFFLSLAWQFVARFWILGRVNVRIFFSYFILFTGICFLHYPFGIFNPGSAIRYRTNFIFLFLILLLYLFVYYKNQGKRSLSLY